MAVKRFGPYFVKKLLGRGGMGAVYAGVRESDQQVVAIKVLAAHFADDEHFQGRFASEIEAMKRLEHPNIVKIIGHGEEDGCLFYSMELVEGRSLFDELKEGRKFHWREVVEIGIDTCAALKHAHDRGIIHRDLKPGNLLLMPNGHVKLADFGIAKLWGGNQLTGDGGVLGTADYMSPEQALGRPATTRSDLYSLGSVLYVMLARRPPFQSKSLPETIKNLTYEKPPPIAELAPDTPPDLATLIDRLLAKDPSERVGTAQSLMNRLKAILQESHTAEPAPPRPKFDEPEEDEEYSLEPLASVDRTEVPDTLESVKPTARIPASGPKARLPLPTGDRGTEIPATVASAVSAKSYSTSAPTVENEGSHFVEIDDEVRRAAARIEEASPGSGPIWPYATAMVIVLLIAVVGLFYSLGTPADEQYQQFVAAAEVDPQRLADRKSELREFVERYPDHPEIDRVKQWVMFAERGEYASKLELRVRFKGTGSLRIYEREFLVAYQLARTDPSAAQAKFEDLIAKYKYLAINSDSERECIQAADFQLESLQQVSEAAALEKTKYFRAAFVAAQELLDRDPRATAKMLSAHLKEVTETPENAATIKEAEKLVRQAEEKHFEQVLAEAEQQGESEPRRAIDLLRGAVSDYQDRSWSRTLVEQANRLITEMQSRSAPSPVEDESN